MNILALDTADQVLSAALSTESGVFYSEIDAGTRHSELLMECVDGLLKTAGLHPEELGLVTCMKGPGSFTGLRIGFSVAKGLALALGIPLIAVPTLDCLAYSLSTLPGIVLPAIDARKSCFYSALYRSGQRLTDYMDASPETIAKELAKLRLLLTEPVMLTGCGAALLAPFLEDHFPLSVDPESRRGRAWELLKIAKNCIVNERTDIDSGPLYLRKSDAELKC